MAVQFFNLPTVYIRIDYRDRPPESTWAFTERHNPDNTSKPTPNISSVFGPADWTLYTFNNISFQMPKS